MPPTTEPPVKRGRRPPPEEEFVKRRDREFPEFEDSSDDGKGVTQSCL
jgi:hypothetical protein